jgi:Icc protein
MSKIPLANVDRRGVLKCLAGAGAGIVWSVSGGVPQALGLGEANAAEATKGADFTFVQISDTHIGFKAEANPDANATLTLALERIGKLPKQPAFMLHTGDVTHLSKPEAFETAEQMLKSTKLDTHYVPGEHDVIGDDGKQFFARFVKEATPGGWYSFDHGGVHFVALINVIGFKPGAGGTSGPISWPGWSRI